MTTSTTRKRQKESIVGHAKTDSPWESGTLGRSEKHVLVASPEVEAALDEALCLQPISVRLQNSLINDLKLIARYHGIGYQPLMRNALHRFARFELREMAETLQKVETARARVQKRKLG